MGKLGDLIEKKSEYYETATKREKAYGDYVACGNRLSEILNNSGFPFLNSYCDISEICDKWSYSGITSFTFTLKTNRQLTSDDIIVIKRYITREMSRSLGIDIKDFKRHYFLSVGGDSLVIQKRVVPIVQVSTS